MILFEHYLMKPKIQVRALWLFSSLFFLKFSVTRGILNFPHKKGPGVRVHIGETFFWDGGRTVDLVSVQRVLIHESQEEGTYYRVGHQDSILYSNPVLFLFPIPNHNH